ncbi:unknown [Ruminococcus sp. CAG:624]|nr:unknown [Ruminococcus sp. CAG:624]
MNLQELYNTAVSIMKRYKASANKAELYKDKFVCVIFTEKERVYSGMSETKTEDDTITNTCAEYNAISAMMAANETRIKCIITVGFNDDKITLPCDKCKEYMLEIDEGNINSSVAISKSESVKLESILPSALKKNGNDEAAENQSNNTSGDSDDFMNGKTTVDFVTDFKEDEENPFYEPPVQEKKESSETTEEKPLCEMYTNKPAQVKVLFSTPNHSVQNNMGTPNQMQNAISPQPSPQGYNNQMNDYNSMYGNSPMYANPQGNAGNNMYGNNPMYANPQGNVNSNSMYGNNPMYAYQQENVNNNSMYADQANQQNMQNYNPYAQTSNQPNSNQPNNSIYQPQNSEYSVQQPANNQYYSQNPYYNAQPVGNQMPSPSQYFQAPYGQAGNSYFAQPSGQTGMIGSSNQQQSVYSTGSTDQMQMNTGSGSLFKQRLNDILNTHTPSLPATNQEPTSMANLNEPSKSDLLKSAREKKKLAKIDAKFAKKVKRKGYK